MALITFSLLFNNHHFLCLKLFISQKLHNHWAVIPYSPFLGHHCTFCLHEFDYSGYLKFKWNHKYLSYCVWLISLSLCFLGSSICCNRCEHQCFMWLSNIQLFQFSSVARCCLTLWDPMDCSTPGLPVHQQPSEFTQTHVHWVGDTIQPSHPLSSPSPPTFNLSQHQGLFKWVSSSYQVAEVLESQLQHQSFQWISRTDFL